MLHQLLLLATSSFQIPLYFEANVGQARPEVLALARSGKIRLEAHRWGLEISGDGGSARLLFDNGRAAAVRFEARLEARVQAVGNGAPRSIPAYERAVLENVWPGIDLVLLDRGGRYAFDLIVAPGADPSRAVFLVEGRASIDPASGALL